MRDDNIHIKEPHRFDRPGDQWCDINDMRTRTWTGYRRRLMSTAFLTVFGVGIGILYLVPRSDILKPGELSSSHSQILAGSVTQQRCGACHVEGSLDPLAWFASSSHDPRQLTQTDLCMDCHHQRIPREAARLAHNLTASHRHELSEKIRNATLDPLPTKFTRTSISQEEIACSVCHKEHHGGKANLTELSDAQCQTCHTKQFESFAKDHPEWGRWPYEERKSISFDHRTHAQIHFAKTSGMQSFDCQACHPMNDASASRFESQSEILRTVPYERACAGCHDDTLNVQQTQGLDLFSIPVMPSEIVDGLTGWPDTSVGFADGQLSPLMRLLLRPDPESKQALRRLHDRELGDLVAAGEFDRDEMRSLAVAIHRLWQELSTKRNETIRRRLGNAGVSVDRLDDSILPLSSQFLQSIEIHWNSDVRRRLERNTATNAEQDTTGANGSSYESEDLLVGQSNAGDLTGDALADDDILLEDPLLNDVLTESDPNDVDGPESANLMQTTSESDAKPVGWTREDARVAISYFGSGHADPVIVSLVESLSRLPTSDPEKRAFLQLPAVAACVECHAGSTNSPPLWKSTRAESENFNSTKFSHRPHLNVGKLGDCRYCHEVASISAEFGSATVESPEEHDFLPLQKATCVACHTAAAAGDRCTQCHRYHMTVPVRTPHIAGELGLSWEPDGVDLR